MSIPSFPFSSTALWSDAGGTSRASCMEARADSGIPPLCCFRSIVATIGPKTNTVEMLGKLRKAGMNIGELFFLSLR